MIEADRQPGILARELGSMLQTTREVAGLSYDQAAARLGCEPDWLVRVETGFAAAGPDEVARILTGYGVREARAADTIIDMARRAAAPPPWLAPHTSRLSAAARDSWSRPRPPSPRSTASCSSRTWSRREATSGRSRRVSCPDATSIRIGTCSPAARRTGPPA